jgi:chemotaxis response regulator CheB
MPKSAVKLGVVDKVVPLENITNEIIKAMEV